jgi:DNA (cytosine-5)-methyltransferase 1
MKYLSVCSGIEAASKAWEPIGWEPVAFSEIEPFPSAVLKHHWPKVQNLGDMTQHEQWNIPSGTVDLLVGGTPCQSFSVAGLRQGLKDPRGNLMLTYLAIAERLKPRWLVWENVPGVLSSNGGKDFGSFLGALGELGYEWAYRVLDAQWFGVAQRRRRVFVVAHLGEGSLAAKVLFESESVRRDTPPSREARQGVATNVAPSLTASNDPSRSPQSSEVTQQVNAVLEATTYRMQAFGEYSNDGTASAMKARDYKDATDLVAEPVAYNITFCDSNGVRSDRLDGGLYVNKTDVTNSLTRAGIGTNVVQPVIAPVVIDRAAFNQGQNAQYKPHIEHSETMDSLVARGPHAVLYENHPNDSRVTGPHDVAPSCVSRYGTGGGNVPLVQEGVDLYNQALTGDVHCPLRTAGGHGAPAALVQEAIPIDLRNANRDPEKHDKINRQGVGVGKIGDPAHTMTKEFTHGVAVAVDTYNQALQEKAAPIRSAASDVCHTGGVINPADRMAVRRLSPRECERLQGFNDDHTLIPWRNKPADQCPDGPRYKALGNSMAVPCMAWIGKRIDAVEKTK